MLYQSFRAKSRQPVAQCVFVYNAFLVPTSRNSVQKDWRCIVARYHDQRATTDDPVVGFVKPLPHGALAQLWYLLPRPGQRPPETSLFRGGFTVLLPVLDLPNIIRPITPKSSAPSLRLLDHPCLVFILTALRAEYHIDIVLPGS